MRTHNPIFLWMQDYWQAVCVISWIRRSTADIRSFNASLSVWIKSLFSAERFSGSNTETLNSGVSSLPASIDASFSGIVRCNFNWPSSDSFTLFSPDLKLLTESSPVCCGDYRMDDRGRGRESSAIALGVCA